MATFQIDGATKTFPAHFSWKDEVIEYTQSGRPIMPIFRTCLVTFPQAMTLANWTALSTLIRDGATHTVKIPHINTGTDTTFTGVFITPVSQDMGMGLYVYGAQILITRISSTA